jgi:hypothetical protein
MNTTARFTNRKLWRLVRPMTLALVLASPMAPGAQAEQFTLYPSIGGARHGR